MGFLNGSERAKSKIAVRRSAVRSAKLTTPITRADVSPIAGQPRAFVGPSGDIEHRGWTSAFR